MSDVLRFSMPKRLMAEMRLAIAAGDVARIAKIYFQMWPEENPQKQKVETFFRREHPHSRFYYTAETKCANCQETLFLCGGKWIHADALYTCKSGKFASGERATGATPVEVCQKTESAPPSSRAAQTEGK